MKKYRSLLIAGIVLSVVTSFLFVVHILMLANIVGKTPQEVHELVNSGKGLVSYLAGHLAVYGFAFVMPLFFCLPLCVFLIVFGSIGLNRAKKQKKEEPYIHGINK